MFLEQYFNQNEQGISFTREQASDFAKDIANDFNPIHDAEAKRFCVPGDLLFSLILSKFGLSESTNIRFSGMVSDTSLLQFNRDDTGEIKVVGASEKIYVEGSMAGSATNDAEKINQVIKAYVAFSGDSFPGVLVPLWKKHDLMINTERPLVMYDSMELNINDFDFKQIELVHSGSDLEVDGKRGKAKLSFDIKSADKLIGHGKKIMTMSSLRQYKQDKIDALVTYHIGLKSKRT
jgi:hypothetical protein